MITPEQTTEKLLLTYYYMEEQGIEIDREGENLFEDNELTDGFTLFLKDSFDMQVPANELSEKKTLGEALDAIIPYLPEDTTQLYSNMADIYCCVCEALDDQVAELFLIDKKKDIAWIGAIAGALLAGVLEALGVAEHESVPAGAVDHSREVAVCLAAVAVEHKHKGPLGREGIGHVEPVFALLPLEAHCVSDGLGLEPCGYEQCRCNDDKFFHYVVVFRVTCQRTTPMLTETFSECFVPYCGISSAPSEASTTPCCTPSTSLPNTRA